MTFDPSRDDADREAPPGSQSPDAAGTSPPAESYEPRGYGPQGYGPAANHAYPYPAFTYPSAPKYPAAPPYSPAYAPAYGWPQGYAPPYSPAYAPAPAYGWPQGYAPPYSPAYAPAPAYGWPQGYGPQGYGWAPSPYAQPGAPWPYPQPSYGGWGYAPSSWGYPYPAVPWGWGYGSPPKAEAPGRLHPPRLPIPINSTRGRAAPRTYAAGWLVTLLGFGTIAGAIVAGSFGAFRDGAGLAFAAVFEVALILLSVGLMAASRAQGSQRRADGWADYFGPSPFLVVLAWLALSLAAELVLIAAVSAVGLTLATSVETLLVLLVNFAAYAFLVHFVVVRPGAMSWRDMVRPRRLAPDPSDWSYSNPWAVPGANTGSNPRALAGDIGLGLALAIPILIATLIFSGILAIILGVKSTDTSEPIPTLFPGWDLWITLISLAVVAPIGEEIFFRGFATNAWARSLKRNDAIIRAALFFAFIHLINLAGTVDYDVLIRAAILAVVARIPVAWALAWLYTRRRSMYATVALHGAYNGGLVLLVWWVSTLQ